MEERAGCARSSGGSLVDSVNQLSQAEPARAVSSPLVVGLFKTARNADETDPGRWETGPGFLVLDARSVSKNNRKSIFDYLKVKNRLGINDQKRKKLRRRNVVSG
jgi:hypothetical protein